MTANRSSSHTIHAETLFQPAAASADHPVDQFPSSRYFQVHFQHLHENNQRLQQQVAQLEQQVTMLSRKLEQVNMLLTSLKNKSMQ